MSEVNHWAEYLEPGSFYPEESTKQLDARSSEEAASKAPARAFCFRLYDTPVVDFEFDAERFRVVPISRNWSGRYYLGGEVFTLRELKAMGDEKRPLVTNIEQYKDQQAIRCRTGNWQPFQPSEGDVRLRV